MNKTVLQGKWRKARGGLKARWGKLTDDDRQMLDGKIDQMVGLFQERYGYTQERASHQLARYLRGYGKHRRAIGADRKWQAMALAMGLITLGMAGSIALARALSACRQERDGGRVSQEAATSPEAQFD